MTIKTIGLEPVKSVYFTECYQPKKGSPEPEKPFLVAGVGFEPTTFWL